jgi:hypothetical protein
MALLLVAPILADAQQRHATASGTLLNVSIHKDGHIKIMISGPRGNPATCGSAGSAARRSKNFIIPRSESSYFRENAYRTLVQALWTKKRVVLWRDIRNCNVFQVSTT